MQAESVSSVAKRNLQLMKILDDAWNAGPNSSLWETFRKRHTENVAVYWPGGTPPTVGRRNHDLEAVEFFMMFPDNHLINNLYKIFFGQGDHTCTVADFSGTMHGLMKGADGKMIQPTHKKFHVEFCTVAHWNDKGEILEERLFFDLVGLMKQIGLS
jgi:SnoaL-like polyketide cyclase